MLAHIVLSLLLLLLFMRCESDISGNVITSRQLPQPASKHRSPGFTSGTHHAEVLAWAVEITDHWKPSCSSAENNNGITSVAKTCQLVNSGQIADLDNWYLLVHDFHDTSQEIMHDALHILPKLDHVPRLRHNISTLMSFQDLTTLKPKLKEVFSEKGLDQIVQEINNCLNSHPLVQSFAQEVIRPRKPRSVQFQDPKFDQQWHLFNHRSRQFDINITGVWERNITGVGVTVAVVDDGLEWKNPDLIDNYRADGSWDLNDKDSDPSPHGEKEKNHHGTRCAGEIAAAANTFCGVGVAFRAGISGLRALDGPMTDSLEATAFTKHMDINDIYSCSWGPDDDGKTVDGPHYLAMQGLRRGIAYGRQGYGVIYIVASGNGGRSSDNCNYDGYSNSIYTLTIGAVDDSGEMPYYAEECASMLAVTFSSGTAPHRNIITTDWNVEGSHGCTDRHTGTSAAAPLAAGMVALMLEARPCLTWRDVQYIVALTAVKVDAQIAHYYHNAAGLSHSHKHGFGLLNAWRLVNTAKVWPTLPFLAIFSSEKLEENQAIPANGARLELQYKATVDTLMGYGLNTLEYVQVTVSLTHERRGDVQISLRCPSGTESLVGAARVHDNSKDGLKAWTFSTVRCWGEAPLGTWTLIVSDKKYSGISRGSVQQWQLTLFGSLLTPNDVQERRSLVERSCSGDYLHSNFSLPCRPAPLYRDFVRPIPEKWLKVMLFTGVFALFIVLYETFEYACCYDKEKKEYKEQMRLAATAARAANENRGENSTNGEAATEEEVHLLGSTSEEIPLNDFRSLLPSANGGPSYTAECGISDLVPVPSTSGTTGSNGQLVRTEPNGQFVLSNHNNTSEEETSFCTGRAQLESPFQLDSLSLTRQPDVVPSRSSQGHACNPQGQVQGQGHSHNAQGSDVESADCSDTDPLLPR